MCFQALQAEADVGLQGRRLKPASGAKTTGVIRCTSGNRFISRLDKQARACKACMPSRVWASAHGQRALQQGVEAC